MATCDATRLWLNSYTPCGRERVGALTIGITSSRNTTFPVSCPLFSGSSLRLFDFGVIVRY